MPTTCRFANRLALAVFVAVVLAAVPASASFELAAKGGYFDPADLYARSFYGSGGIFGLHFGWTHKIGLGVRLESDFYPKDVQCNGRTSRAVFIPTTVSGIYIPLQDKIATPVIGFGWGLDYLFDKSDDGDNHESYYAMLYHGLLGVRFNAYKGLFVDLTLDYSQARLNKGLLADIGGWTTQAGLGWRFD